MFYNRLAPILGALLFLSSCGGIFFQQDRKLHATPKRFNIKFSEVQFPSKNGNLLNAWILPSATKETKGTIIHFHGNAENISTHFFYLAWLIKEGYQVFSFDYQGYGKSEGSPNRVRAYEDGLAALSYAHKLWNNEGKFIVYGASLGGIISLRSVHDFKEKKDIDLFVLDSTFMSYNNIVFHKLSRSWITILFSPLAYVFYYDHYAPQRIIEDYSKEISFLSIHGTNDSVVPYSLGKKLFKALPTKNKEFWEIQNGKHTDVFYQNNFKYRKDFIKKLNSI